MKFKVMEQYYKRKPDTIIIAGVTTPWACFASTPMVCITVFEDAGVSENGIGPAIRYI